MFTSSVDDVWCMYKANNSNLPSPLSSHDLHWVETRMYIRQPNPSMLRLFVYHHQPASELQAVFRIGER